MHHHLLSEGVVNEFPLVVVTLLMQHEDGLLGAGGSDADDASSAKGLAGETRSSSSPWAAIASIRVRRVALTIRILSVRVRDGGGAAGGIGGTVTGSRG